MQVRKELRHCHDAMLVLGEGKGLKSGVNSILDWV